MQEYRINIIIKKLCLSVVASIMISLSLFGANPVKIMPLGDSITVGYDPVDNLVTNNWVSYRGPLWTKLSSGEYNVDFVGNQLAGSDYKDTIDPSFDLNHQGFNGIHADAIASDVNGYLTTNPADVVLLHIGTNDLYHSESIVSTVSDVNAALENIDSFSKDIKVIIARIINRGTYDADTTIFNNELNTMVEQRISNGDDIIIVDMENGADLNYTTDMINDLHPNTTGYEKIADLWYSELSTILTPTLPMHLWKLDEGPAATTYVDFYSGADGNCTEPGCPTTVAGQINGAQSFDGNDEIDVMDSSTFDWTSDSNVTIEFWIKSDSSTKPENEVIIGRKGELSSASSDIWYVGIEAITGNIAYGLGNKDGSITHRQGSIQVANSNWNHVAFVVTSDRIKIYVNGQIDVDIARTNSNSEHIQGTPVNIGYIDWRDRFEYIGLLDELAVYDSELSAGLIQQHFKNGFKPHLAEVTAVPTPTNIDTPDYTFSTDEAGTISYDGSCSSATTIATVGDNTITFDALTDATYNDCTITITDAASNDSTPLAVTEFTVDTVVPDTTAPTLAEVTPVPTPTSSGGGCSYNPNSKNFDMSFLLMIALGLLYPFRRRFIK